MAVAVIGNMVGRQRWLPRWVHRAYADWLGSYFWITCEDCGKWWGGHEWIDSNQTRRTDPTGGVAAYCPECGRSGRHPSYDWTGMAT